MLYAVMIKKHARPTVVLDEMRKLQAVNYQPEILTERPSAENLTNWNVRHEIISIAPWDLLKKTSLLLWAQWDISKKKM